MYETTVNRETADKDPSDNVREFALIWQTLPKVVFSRTLDSVEGANTTLARDDLRAELDLAPGVRAWRRGGKGAELAAEAARLDLIDEYRLFVHPVAEPSPSVGHHRHDESKQQACLRNTGLGPLRLVRTTQASAD